MKIHDFVKQYDTMTIQVSPGVSYNLRDVINESYRLYNARFEGNDMESSGFRRIFYRMIWVIFRTIIMASDIDLKDLNLRSLNGKGLKVLFILKMAVHSHLSRTYFGKYVDKVMADMVWFGTSLTKRVDGSVETVDLRNYTTESTVKDPQARSHAEMCFYSWDQVQSHKEDWKKVWDQIENQWEKMKKENVSRFKIVEFWTFDVVDSKEHKVCKKYLDTEMDQEMTNPNDWNPYIELETFITPYKKKRTSKRMITKLGEYEEMFPYEQAGFFEAPGRWLDFGCAELLTGLQEHYNEYTNDKRKKDILDLKGIFVHKYSNSSNSLTQDVIANLDTHAVMQMSQDEDFQRLVVDTKTAEYINNVDKLYELMRLILGVTAQGTGEELPASTSATQASINAQTSATTYDFVRERLHHFLIQLFQNGYFEDIIDEITEEEITAIVGDPKQLEELDSVLVDTALRGNFEQQLEGVQSTDQANALIDNTMQQKQELMDGLKQHGDMRFPEIKKEILKDIEYYTEFYVNNETFDKKTMVDMLNSIKADPNSTKNKEAVEDQLFDLMNMNPRQFDKTPEQKAQEAEIQRQQMMQEQGMMQPANPISQVATANMLPQ
jgi:hypothetical protein